FAEDCRLIRQDLKKRIPPDIGYRLVQSGFIFSPVGEITAIAVRYRIRTFAHVSDRKIFTADAIGYRKQIVCEGNHSAGILCGSGTFEAPTGFYST
ncbi:MAG: hypothetical protein PVI90_17790, partial [Desulfobacteraceae bacterium]